MIPPWPMLYHIIELIILLLFYVQIASPTIFDYFLHRQIFVDAFYPDDGSDDDPLFDNEVIIDYFDQISEKYEEIKNASFMNLRSYSDITCKIFWRNGTNSTSGIPEISREFFRHVKKFITSVDFYTLSEMKSTLGCSNWIFSVEIYAKEGLSQFSIQPSIKRTHCNQSVIQDYQKDSSNDPMSSFRELKTQNRKQQSQLYDTLTAIKLLKSKKLRSRRERNSKLHKTKKNTVYHPPKKFITSSERKMKRKATSRKTYEYKPADLPVFNRVDLPFYRITHRIFSQLTAVSCLHLCVLLYRLRKMYLEHLKLSKVAPEYRLLPLSEQYHMAIGYWTTIDLISTILIVISSIYMIHEANILTQFVSQVGIELVSVAMGFSLIRVSQWFIYYMPFYQLIVILRAAFMQLVYLIISILPLVTGFSLLGIFSFGFIDETFLTFRYLVQRMITSGMGDSIDDFFIIIDDGTTLVSWLSFIYVGTITAAGMWIIFTSCIATIQHVHHSYILEHDSFWESSSDSGGSDETH